MSNTGIRYITYSNGRYIIKRHIQGEQVYFASFNNLEDAKEYLEYIKANNWSLECKKRYTRKNNHPLAYISQPSPSTYQVHKLVDGRMVQYASFNNLDEAIMYRDYCVEHNWSKDCIRRKSEKYNLPKYISWNKKAGKYCINKYRDGKVIFHNFYHKLEDALRERDLLIKYDWDEDKLIEHDETFGSIWR